MNLDFWTSARWLAALLPLLCAAFSAPVTADVVRCLDTAGNITYQDVPCQAGQAGRAVALPPAESRDNATAWEVAARDARVVKGMPKRWVLRARGTPTDIRPGTVREAATEVWRYAGRDGVMIVGFAGSDVAWVRDETAETARRSEAAGAPGKVDAGPALVAADATRGAQNRRFIIAGRYCEHVLAEVGPPDRQEALAGAPDGSLRYFHEPQAGDPQMRTVWTCVAGRVADVERTVVR